VIVENQILERQPPHYRYGQMLIWLLMASSSIVFIEPAPFDILGVGLVFLFLVLGLRIPREIGAPILLLGIFLLGNIIAATTSADPGTSIRPTAIRSHLVVTWVFLVSVMAANPATMIDVVWRGYIAAAFIAAVWAILGYFGVLPEGAGTSSMRAAGPFKDANVYAPFLVPPTIYLTAKLLTTSGARLLGSLFLFTVFVLGLLLAFSRGAWLNFAVSFTLFISISAVAARTLTQKLRLIFLAASLLVVAAVVVAWAISSSAVGELFSERAVLVQEYDTEAGGRFYTQQRVLQEAARNPLGIGPGHSSDKFDIDPHNIYLHVIVEGGWLAAFGFYGFLALTILRSLPLLQARWSFRRELFVAWPCLLGMLLQSFFIDSTHWRHFYVLLAILWGILVTGMRENRIRGRE
jgi:hypothetical protein